MARDDFSATTKSALAKRAGFRCSYPNCDAVTIGPSDEGEEATANTGAAAHICAASSGRGSRRYDPHQTEEQRSSIDNGLWCCNYHAKLIDTDESTYTVEMLRKWRALAEKRAQLRQAYGANFSGISTELLTLGLAPEYVSLKQNLDVNEIIGTAVENSWISEICGKEPARILRDFLIEYATNALSHGEAQQLKISFGSNSILVEDDGNEFHVEKLLSEDARGGGLAYKELLATRHFGHTSYRRSIKPVNNLYIPFVASADNLPRANPCAVSLSRADLRTGQFDLSNLALCDRAFIITSDFMSYSDAPFLLSAIKSAMRDAPNLTLILTDVSEGVMRRFRELLPNLRIESW